MENTDVNKILEMFNVNKEESQETNSDERCFLNLENYDIESIEDGSTIDIESTSTTSENPVPKPGIIDNISILTANEKVVVDSCDDSDLKKLLMLNRTKNLQLIQLYKQIKDMLMECIQAIAEKNSLIKVNDLTPKYQRYSSTGAWRLGAPYFKDKNLFSCPPNADTIRRKENNELSVYDFTFTQKWTLSESDSLLRAVQQNFGLNKKKEIKKALASTEKEDSETFKKLTAELEVLEAKDYYEVPPLHSDVNINWCRVSTHYMKSKYSDTECRAYWQLYVHPSINKSPWASRENNRLKLLVRKYKCQNWDAIVRELGTNRTVYTACVNYFVNLYNKYKKGEFTYSEDKKLVDLVKEYSMGSYIPWVKIAENFKNRTRSQLHHRYTCFLSQDTRKRGRFTDAEDLILLICVDKYGKRFKKCREHLPHRQQVQLKARFNTNLTRYLKKGSWSEDDDKTIMDYVKKNGTKKWSPIAQLLARSRGQVRQRYSVICHFLKKFPNAIIQDFPRRKHVLQKEEEKFYVLRSIADEYRNLPVPTLKEAEKVLKDRNIMESSSSEDDNDNDDDDDEDNQEDENKKSLIDRMLELETESEGDSGIKQEEEDEEDREDKNIDRLLTEYFVHTKEKTKEQIITSENIIEATDYVQILLDALKANLDIPEYFDVTPDLDNIDLAILMHLKERIVERKVGNDLEPLTVIPPNLYTVKGLQGLMKKCSKVKRSFRTVLEFGAKHPHTRFPLKRTIESELLNSNPQQRIAIESERNLFYQRFHALFKWPAILSCEQPHIDLENTAGFLHVDPISVKRTYGKSRTTTIVTETPVKKIKTTDIPLGISSNILQLTPVTDKSVIENLLTDKNKKLFTIENVETEGTVRAVIKRVKFPVGKADLPGKKLGDASACSIPSTSKSVTTLNYYREDSRAVHIEVVDNEDSDIEGEQI